MMRRILGIDPSTRCVAFAVLEGSDLIDWGTRTTRKADSDLALSVIRALIDRFQPQIIAIEDTTSPGSRRCVRVRKLLDAVAATAPKSATVRRIPVARLATPDQEGRAATKYQRALALAKRFQELQSRLPRVRKPWMSEDARINIFDALSFALACIPTTPKVDRNADAA